MSVLSFCSPLYSLAARFRFAEVKREKFDGLNEYADIRSSFIITVTGCRLLPRRLVAIPAVGNNPKSMAVIRDAARTVIKTARLRMTRKNYRKSYVNSRLLSSPPFALSRVRHGQTHVRDVGELVEYRLAHSPVKDYNKSTTFSAIIFIVTFRKSLIPRVGTTFAT